MKKYYVYAAKIRRLFILPDIFCSLFIKSFLFMYKTGCFRVQNLIFERFLLKKWHKSLKTCGFCHYIFSNSRF